MKWMRIAAVLAFVLLLQPACKSEPTPEPTPEPVVTETGPMQDVTVCIMTTGEPDIMEPVVKADKKTRVHWKSHTGAYLVYFKDSMPFDDEGDDTQTIGGTSYKIIKVPAGADSRSFILKDTLAPGEKKTYKYYLDTDPPSKPTPPNGPAIIGEG
jgi:hypothetical protein